MEFFRQEYWSGQPFPSPGDLPNLGVGPRQILYHLSYWGPHRDRAKSAFECFSVSCRQMGQQWLAMGTGVLAAAYLGGRECGISSLLEEVASSPIIQ